MASMRFLRKNGNLKWTLSVNGTVKVQYQMCWTY